MKNQKNAKISAVIAIIFAIVGAILLTVAAIAAFGGQPASNSSTPSSSNSTGSGNPGVQTPKPTTPEPEEEPADEEPEIEPEMVTIEVTNEDGTVEEHTITADQLPQVGDLNTNRGNIADIMRPNKIMGEHADGVLRSSSASMRRINAEISGFSDGVTKRPGFDQAWADQGTIWSPNAANETPLTIEQQIALWKERKAAIDALTEAEQIELYGWCANDEIYNNIVCTDMAYQTFEQVPFFSTLPQTAETLTDFRTRMNVYCDVESREANGLPVGKDAFFTYDSAKYKTDAEIMGNLEKTAEFENDSMVAVTLFQWYKPVGIEKRTTSGVFHMVPTADDRIAFAVWTTDPQFQETDIFLILQLKVKTDADKELVLDEIGMNLRDGRIVRFAAKQKKSKRSSSTTTTTTTTTQEQEQEQNHSSSDGGPGDNPNTQTETGKDPAYGSGQQGHSTPGYGPNQSSDGSGGVSTEPEKKYDQIQEERKDTAENNKETIKNEVSDKNGGTTQNGTPPVTGKESDLNSGYNTGESTGGKSADTEEKKDDASKDISDTNITVPD